jgi:hypothetical protein
VTAQLLSIKECFSWIEGGQSSCPCPDRESVKHRNFMWVGYGFYALGCGMGRVGRLDEMEGLNLRAAPTRPERGEAGHPMWPKRVRLRYKVGREKLAYDSLS